MNKKNGLLSTSGEKSLTGFEVRCTPPRERPIRKRKRAFSALFGALPPQPKCHPRFRNPKPWLRAKKKADKKSSFFTKAVELKNPDCITIWHREVSHHRMGTSGCLLRRGVARHPKASEQGRRTAAGRGDQRIQVGPRRSLENTGRSFSTCIHIQFKWNSCGSSSSDNKTLFQPFPMWRLLWIQTSVSSLSLRLLLLEVGRANLVSGGLPPIFVLKCH